MSTQADEETGPFIVSLSVGGMTCASCVTAIMENMSRLSGVSEPSVSLLQGSATAVVMSRELADTIQTTIEDSGFECQVIEVVSIHQKDDTLRTVSLRVDGMFSQ